MEPSVRRQETKSDRIEIRKLIKDGDFESLYDSEESSKKNKGKWDEW